MLIEYIIRNNIKEISKIENLQEYYGLAKIKFDNEEIFKKKSYERVLQLQQNKPEIIKIWKHIKNISLKSFNEIYKRLDISL